MCERRVERESERVADKTRYDPSTAAVYKPPLHFRRRRAVGDTVNSERLSPPSVVFEYFITVHTYTYIFFKEEGKHGHDVCSWRAWFLRPIFGCAGQCRPYPASATEGTKGYKRKGLARHFTDTRQNGRERCIFLWRFYTIGFQLFIRVNTRTMSRFIPWCWLYSFLYTMSVSYQINVQRLRVNALQSLRRNWCFPADLWAAGFSARAVH